MTHTLTTEALRALRDSLKSWQDGYDPVDDKEQYEMFVTAETAIAELLAKREAQPVALNTDRIMEIMLQEWCEWLDDTGHFPDDFVWTGGNGMLFYEPSRWSKLVADRIIANTAPPAPAVPKEMTKEDAMAFVRERPPFKGSVDCVQATWNACRAAMLAAPEGGNDPDTRR